MKTYLLFFFLLISFPSLSQISLGGTPYSMTSNGNGLNLKPKPFKLPALDNAHHLNEAKKHQASNKSQKEYYGKGINTNVDLKKTAAVYTVPEGKIWMLQFESETAYGMQFYFSMYNLPEKASLFIYNEDKSTIMGAFTHINNHPKKTFATTAIYGNKITLEYFEATGSEFSGSLEIEKVVHIFKDPKKTRGISERVEGALPCAIDINCPDGASYQDIKQSVCRISTYDIGLDFTGYVTGFLVNNSQPSGTQRMPYVLTANHALESGQLTPTVTKDRVDWWLFEFWYEAPTCGSTIPPTIRSTNGCSVITRSVVSDYLLLDLQTTSIESFIDVYYAGWNAAFGQNYSGTVNISHPLGGVKTVALAPSTPATIYFDNSLGWGSLDPTIAGNTWKIDWSTGITESNSSGSPLFDMTSGRAIGLLSGGNSTCDSNGGNKVTGPDYFPMLSYCWSNVDAPYTSPLGNYLNASGAITNRIMDGFNPPAPTTPPSGCNLYPATINYSPKLRMTPSFNLGDFNGTFGWIKIRANLSNGTSTYATDCAGNVALGVTFADYNKQLPSGTYQGYAYLYKEFPFEAGKEYVLSIMVWGRTVQGGMALTLQDQSNAIGQYIMILGTNQINQSGAYNWSTYAVKFISNGNYPRLGINFNSFRDDSSGNDLVFFDNVYLYQKGAFINPKCSDDVAYTSLPPQAVSLNNSITLSGTGTQAVYSNESLVSHKVSLQNGFWAKSGSTFDAVAEDCISLSSSPYNPVGPLEENKKSSMVRVGAIKSDPEFIIDYSGLENVYRKDLKVENIAEMPIVAYPNPTTGKIKVIFNDDSNDVPYSVVDVSGRVIERGYIRQNQELDLSPYTNGVYILKVFTNLPQTFKVVLNK